jgi:pimeloyl-ACP methyl ester carboxylesterase
VVAEVHTLLTKAGVPGPYIMVGHSLGGAFSLLYARTHPDQVKGLVLVDPAQPFMRKLFPPQVWKTNQEIGLHPDSPIPGYQQEAYDQDSSYNQVEAAPPLRLMPTVILARGKPDSLPDPLPSGPVGEVLTTLNRVWPQAQLEFAASIPGARLITVPDTTHYVHNQRPDSVIDAIRQVIAQAASPRPTTT